jgi:hypothetical protein
LNLSPHFGSKQLPALIIQKIAVSHYPLLLILLFCENTQVFSKVRIVIEVLNFRVFTEQEHPISRQREYESVDVRITGVAQGRLIKKGVVFFCQGGVAEFIGICDHLGQGHYYAQECEKLDEGDDQSVESHHSIAIGDELVLELLTA